MTFHGQALSLWRPEAGTLQFTQEGTVELGVPSVASPDGKLLFGTVDHRTGACYRTDTWQGLWQFDPKSVSFVFGAVFSTDGKALFVLAKREGGRSLLMLDAESGGTLREVPLGNDGILDHASQGTIALVSKAVFLTPAVDAESRVLRIPLDTWKPEPLRISGGERNFWGGSTQICVTPDERWVAVWERTRTMEDGRDYQIMEKTTAGYTARIVGTADCGVNALVISPDGRQLVISGDGRHRVMDLATRKVVHADEGQCRCGLFSPDGRYFLRMCDTFEVIDPKTWNTAPGGRQPGHGGEVFALSFSPDGRWLASSDGTRLLIWPVNGSAPVAECISPRLRPSYQPMRWSNDCRHLQAGDGWDYLQWTWDGKPGATPLQGTVFVPGPAETHDRAKNMEVVGNHAETRFLTGSAHQQGIGASDLALRDPARPGVAQRLDAIWKQGGGGLMPRRFFFSMDDEEIYYGDYSPRALRLADSSIREMSLGIPGGDLVACDPVAGRLICVGAKGINVVKASDLTVEWTLPNLDGLRFSSFEPAAVSPDGRWVAVQVSGTNLDGNLGVVDLQQRKLAALHRLPWQAFRSITFTADGKRIALGHLSGAISSWDVEKLIATAPPPAPKPAAPVAATASKASHTAVTGRWTARELPDKPDTLKDGTELRWLPDGGVAFSKRLPGAGMVRINGAAPVTVAVRLRPETPSSNQVCIEQSALDGRVRLGRKISQGLYGLVSWLDSLDNVTDGPVEFDFDCICKFSRPVEEWKSDVGGALRVSNGELALPTDTQCIYTSGEGADGGTFDGFRFAISPAPERPKLLVGPDSHSLTARYHLRLPPHDRRMLLHAALVQAAPRRGDPDSLRQLVSPAMWPAVSMYHPVWSKFSVNVGEPPAYTQMKEQTAAKARQKAAAYSPFSTDQMGFKWTLPRDPFGFSTEMGLVRCLEPWVDDTPLFFMEKRDDAATVRRSTDSQWSNASGTLRLLRMESLFTAKATGVQVLEISNVTDQPQLCRLRLMNVATQAISALLSAQGQPLDVSQLMPFAKHQGTVAVVCPGGTQPATLLAIGSAGAKVSPTLRVIDGRVLLVDYELSLAPRESASLFQAATQRPLSAYGNAAEALASWNVRADMPLFVPSGDSSAPLLNWSSP